MVKICWVIVACGIGLFMEPWFGLGSPWWLAVSGAALVVGYCRKLWNFVRGRGFVSNGPGGSFNMTFGDAIAHCLLSGSRHISWGYENRPTAERLVARDIVEEARKGKIRVSGIPHKATHPRKINKRKLKQLVPYDELVPKSPETPDGYAWMLGPKDPSIGELSPDEDDGCYRGLRVDSRDIYKLWPKNKS